MATIITKPKVEIDASLLAELKTLVKEESQVIVHCLFDSIGQAGCLIRIWPTTYLYDRGSSHRSELAHYDNITLYPVWTEIPDNAIVSFSLIFTGLPKSCTVFDLEEVIPQSGGFSVSGIKRNDSDVYYVRV